MLISWELCGPLAFGTDLSSPWWNAQASRMMSGSAPVVAQWGAALFRIA